MSNKILPFSNRINYGRRIATDISTVPGYSSDVGWRKSAKFGGSDPCPASEDTCQQPHIHLDTATGQITERTTRYDHTVHRRHQSITTTLVSKEINSTIKLILYTYYDTIHRNKTQNREITLSSSSPKSAQNNTGLQQTIIKRGKLISLGNYTSSHILAVSPYSQNFIWLPIAKSENFL